MPESPLSVEIEPRRLVAPQLHGLRAWFRRVGPLMLAAFAIFDRVRPPPAKGQGLDFLLVSMAPTTAAVVVLLCLALGLTSYGASPRRRRYAVLAICLIVAYVGAHTLVCRLRDTVPVWESWRASTNLAVEGLATGRMSYQTAILAILSAFAVSALFSPLASRPRMRDSGIVVALLVQLFGIVAGISFTAGNPVGALNSWLRVVPVAVFCFLAFNTLLLFRAHAANRLRQWFFGTEILDHGEAPIPRDERVVITWLTVAAAGAIIGSIVYLRVQTGHRRSQTIEAIQTLSDLKVRQVEQWRRERLGDARSLGKMPFLVDAVAALGDSSANAGQPARLEQWLRVLRDNYDYAQVVIFDRTKTPAVSYPPGVNLSSAGLQESLTAVQPDSDVVELPPYVDRRYALHWDLLVPLQGLPGDLAGLLWLQALPQRPIISQLEWWPDEFQTGQTVLWAREGGRLVSLGGIRAKPDQPATLTHPLEETRVIADLPATSVLGRVLRGETDVREGLDHGGIPIIGLGHPIRNSNWILTSRVNASEVYASLRHDAWIVAGLVIGLLGTTAGTTSWLWRQRQKNLINERLLADLEQRRTAARLGMVMHEARDIILVVDEDLRVLDANRQAAEAFGWTPEELRTRRIQDLRAPETLADLPGIVSQTRSAGGAFFETIYRRRDGSTFPAEASVRNVVVDGKNQSLAIIRDISERKRAEAELRASEERYRLIAENTSDVIWLYDFSRKGFTYMSAASSSLLGYTPEELLGVKLTFTLTGESAGGALAIVDQLLAEARSGAAPRHAVVELDQRRKDGSVVPTEVVASVVASPSGGAGHILGITRDITERKRAREALEKFNTELEQRVEERTSEIQALLDAIPDTVLLCDEQGAVVFARSVKYPGVSGLIAGETSAFTRPELDALIREIIRDLQPQARADGQMIVREYERLIETGKQLWLEARAAPMPQGRVLVLLREISERKRHELGVQANLARERQLSEMKSQFVSVASHEFRTPLAAAVGTLELLERHAAKLTEAKRVELLARIQRSLSRLTEIMNDVLQLSRADSGRIKATRMNTDLIRLTQDILHEVETGDGSKHRFVFESSGGPGTVPVDTKLTNHILSNLTGNAVRYSPAGTTVTVKLHIDEAAFTLLVTDQGIGIPAAERDHVFEPFARGSNVGQISGTGLGLNIVKRYTELMGGTIELLPMERGTTFKVRVPLVQIAAL